MKRHALTLIGILMGLGLAATAQAYTGTNCKEPGVCWEPKPGYPEKIKGTRYDPKHDPKELDKQRQAIEAMDKRNRLRWQHFKKTGKFVYDVDEIGG
ncbi:methanol dehydrogenase (cytochrome c) subunit 2 [Methylomarinovum tepidoasis]|uniref:Methanol dehydrogenase [cytochrome c] subunit 2 n=1 Tax=Methylomarinovum tepidoasis TaxID=2840183 RepID=A0AAU9CSA6_9GAMM|nr:methanol dehydrogenase [cytochrome c] subunit [Methylomarinovum sp. IN45]BCX89253.1 methanol dehydrogenase (cytochrome c) subunit 2 [Methylomarinovum sp. IN45]